MRIRWRGFELPTHVTLNKETATDKYGMSMPNRLSAAMVSRLEFAAARAAVEPGRRGGDVSAPRSRPQRRRGEFKTTQISHEFTAIPGLFEDVEGSRAEHQGNAAQAVHRRSSRVEDRAQDQGADQAGDIVKNERFEIVNPEPGAVQPDRRRSFRFWN